MKNVLALSIALLVPAVPVLADVAPKQTPGAIVAQETSDWNTPASQAAATPAGAPATPAGTPATPAGAPATPDATAKPEGTKLDRSKVGNITTETPKEKKKPGMLAKMKAKLMNFVTKHPVLAGAILGGMLCIAGGPAIFVIGVALGAVAGDVADYEIDKFKHPGS